MIIDTHILIDELKKRGLVVSNYEEFEYYVTNFNVNTFITQYSDFFENEKGMFNNVDAGNIIKLYIFDKNLANHIFRNILVIEKMMNTRVAVETINFFEIKDKCLLTLDPNILKNSVLRNIHEVEPYIDYKGFLFKMVKYLETNKAVKSLADHSTHDEIQKWSKVPLDLMCLSWSFSTTFSFFIASGKELRHKIMANFNIGEDHYKGFVDFVKNIINLRNYISHNGVIYDLPVKYKTTELTSLYKELFKENVEVDNFRLIHIVRMIARVSHDDKLYEKTASFGKNLDIDEPYKSKIAKLFEL